MNCLNASSQMSKKTAPVQSSARLPSRGSFLSQHRCACGGSAAENGQYGERQQEQARSRHRESISEEIGTAWRKHMPNRETESGLGRNLTKTPLFAPGGSGPSQASSPLTAPPVASIIQPKLVVGDVSNPLEHEADRVADQVMRMTASELSVTPVAPKLSRKCASCQEEETQKLRTARQQTSNARAEPEAPSIVYEVLRSPGQPLDSGVRKFLEPRFGHDFSQVRVHTNARAAESARALGAHAYTVGTNVVFGRGEFAPMTTSGRRLIAHELAHVIQQTDIPGRVSTLQMAVRRAVDEGAVGDGGEASPASSGSSQIKDTSNLKPGIDLDEAEGRAFANQAIAKMSPYGAVIAAPPSDAVASIGSGGGDSTNASATDGSSTASELQVMTSALGPTVQRSGGGRVKPEGGFVGSIQICYDMCSGELSAVGWIWAGGGVVTKGLLGGSGWWGAYVFAEKDFPITKLNFMPILNCGTCAPNCKPEEAAPEWGAGVSGFPVAIKPGQRASLKQAGIELGLLLTVRSSCDADLEIIALVDLTKYLGPIGAAVVAAEELANKLGKRLNIEVECGVGVDVSGAAHLCKSVPGGGLHGVTADSAKICGGGYVGCGIGLEHDKSALPGI